MRKILILAANPRYDLALDREIRDLQGVIERSRSRESFEIAIGLAVRTQDLQDLMLRHQPQIVHFCGHGSGTTGLIFESDGGQTQLVSTEALSGLFRLFMKRGLECILLNACYSEVQAEAIVQHISYVIGMRQTIQDKAAIAFSTGFYRALGYECSIEEAFEFGCNAIQLGLSGSPASRLGSEAQRKLEVIQAVTETAIPEHLKPILKIRADLLAQVKSSLPYAGQTQTTLQLTIDRALEQEAEIRRDRPSPDPPLAAIQPDALQPGLDHSGLSQPGLHQPASDQPGLDQSRLSQPASGLNYSKLQNFLKAHQWKEADLETQRLMLTVAQREQEGWLGEAEIRQFPCADLQLINHLWTTYSNGRFGFSVQRDIFLQSGGQIQGKHDEAVWMIYGDRVGWIKEGGLIANHQVITEDSAPVGHLPFQVYWGGGCLMLGSCVRWAQRFTTCQI